MKEIYIQIDKKYQRVNAESVYKRECQCKLNNELMKESLVKLREFKNKYPEEKFHLETANKITTVADNDFYQAMPGTPRISGLDGCTIEIYKIINN